MKFLISQRHEQNKHGDWIDILENNYVTYFKSFGVTLIPISNVEPDIERFVFQNDITAIVLSGGGNVNPELFGGASSENNISKERDRVESELIKYSIQEKLPLLGICRGMHMINVFFKGSLLVNIPSMDPQEVHPTPGRHKLKLSTSINSAYPLGTEIETNSYHDQGIGINMLGNGIKPFADFPALDLVEGIYHEEYPIAGIQWHPDREVNKSHFDNLLIKSFISKQIFWIEK